MTITQVNAYPQTTLLILVIKEPKTAKIGGRKPKKPSAKKPAITAMTPAMTPATTPAFLTPAVTTTSKNKRARSSSPTPIPFALNTSDATHFETPATPASALKNNSLLEQIAMLQEELKKKLLKRENKL